MPPRPLALVVLANLAPLVPVAHAGEDAAAASIPIVEIIERRIGATGLSLPGLRAPRRLLPIAVERIEPALVAQDPARDLADLLETASSALVVSAEGASVNDVYLRGFGDTSFFRNGLNDSLGTLAPRPLAAVEAIEIVKGPSAALLGPGKPGGSVSYVTKRPQTMRATSVGAGAARFGESTFDLDATGPVPGAAAVQYRLIAERLEGDTFRDHVDNDRWFIAPSLAWQPSAHSDVVVSVEYVELDRLLDAGIYAVPDRPSVPRRRFLGEPGAGEADNDGLTAQAALTLALDDGWLVELQSQVQRTRLDGIAVEPDGFDDTLLVREAQRRDENAESWIVQLEAGREYALAGTRHDVLAGFELTGVDEDVTLLASDPDDDPFAIDPLAPAYGQPLPALEAARRSTEERRQLALYVRDRIDFGAHWHALLAARFDHIEQSGHDRVAGTRFEDDSARVSPRVGLVFDTLRGVVLYSSYSRSIDPNEGLQPDGSALAPTLAQALEAGLRAATADERLTLNMAAYVIRQRNVTVDAPGRPGFELQTARQQNLGIDLELRWQPLPGLDLSARYNWVDTRIANDPLVPDGTDAPNVPRHQAGFAAFWQPRERLSLGLLLGYVGSRPASLEPEQLAIDLDDYVRLDVFARWQPHAALELRAGVRNLTDADYIQGSQGDAFSLSPGAPRTLHGEIRVRF